MIVGIPAWIIAILAVIVLWVLAIIISMIRAMAYKSRYLRTREDKGMSIPHLISVKITEPIASGRKGRKFVASVFSTIFSPKDYERLFDEANGTEFNSLTDATVRESYRAYMEAYRLAATILCSYLLFMFILVLAGNLLGGTG